MRLYISNYIFTGSELLKDTAVIMKNDTVLDIGNYKLIKKSYPEAVINEFSSGVLFPGFINTHTHLELGYLKGKLPEKMGFVSWLKEIMLLKGETDRKTILNSIYDGVKQLKRSGVSVVGDISNTLLSPHILKQEMPDSVVFFENYSLNKEKACKVISELEKKNLKFGIRLYTTPHSIYSSHQCLMKYLCKRSNKLSLHFLESKGELEFFKRKGELYDFLNEIGLIEKKGMDFKDHWDFLSRCGCLTKGSIFVHCTYSQREDFERIKEIDGTVCLCLRSNDYITGNLPDMKELLRSGANISIGTDSLASNINLNFLEELRFIKDKFPYIEAKNIFSWAIKGGARALDIGWGFYRNSKAKPIFIPTSSTNPLEEILENQGDEPPRAINA